MQDRAERDETRAAKLAEAKREFKDTCRQDLSFAMAIYRARLIAIGLPEAERNRELGSIGNVISLRRVA
jgi:hypothetical protein